MKFLIAAVVTASMALPAVFVPTAQAATWHKCSGVEQVTNRNYAIAKNIQYLPYRSRTHCTAARNVAYIVARRYAYAAKPPTYYRYREGDPRSPCVNRILRHSLNRRFTCDNGYEKYRFDILIVRD